MSNMTESRPDYSDIGNRIVAFRRHLNMSATKFAKEHGFSKSQLGNWEAGSRRISIDAAMRLCDLYGLTLDYIYIGRLSSLPHSLAVLLSDKE